MSISIFITALVLLGLSILPRSRKRHWIVRGWEFIRYQLLVLNIAVAIWAQVQFFISLDWLVVFAFILALFSIFYQLRWIRPYLPFAKVEVKKVDGNNTPTISLLSSNVYTPNKDSHRLVQLVEELQPSIVLTLETDQRWERELEVLHANYPYRVPVPKDNLYGMHLYCKWPLSDVEVEYIVEEDVPSISCFVAHPSGKKVRLLCAHPAPPSPTENETSIERDVELGILALRAREQNAPTIATGDFNDVAWSPSTEKFIEVSQLKDPRKGRGFFNTFPTWMPLLRVPLDHVFVSHHFDLIELRRERSIGSDHFPMYAKLALREE